METNCIHGEGSDSARSAQVAFVPTSRDASAACRLIAPGMMPRLLPSILAALLALSSVALSKAPPAKKWERLDGVRYIPQQWNDGDSFHVVTAEGREVI